MRWQISRSGETYYIKDKLYVGIIKVVEGQEGFGVFRSGSKKGSRDPDDTVIQWQEGGTLEESLNLLAKQVLTNGLEMQQHFKHYWDQIVTNEGPVTKARQTSGSSVECPHCRKGLIISPVQGTSSKPVQSEKPDDEVSQLPF